MCTMHPVCLQPAFARRLPARQDIPLPPARCPPLSRCAPLPSLQPAFVFPAQLGSGTAKYVWEATSHELGHNMG